MGSDAATYFGSGDARGGWYMPSGLLLNTSLISARVLLPMYGMIDFD